MSSQQQAVAETTERPKWKIMGPGLVVAATGVGAADLVATLVAGSQYAYTLLWCAVLGCVMKVVLVEGAARYSLATRRTIFEGWQTLGRWTSWYFGPYIVVWGFVYGAAAMAGTGLPLNALFPGLSVPAWGIISGLIGFVLVWFGRYGVFEKVITAMVALMFVSMVGAAALTVPDLPRMAAGLLPVIPDADGGGIVYTLSLAGGVGGTITLAAYGYWLREKGWDTPRYMRVMRIDNTMAYVMTGVFVVSTLIVGAELLYSAGISVSDSDDGEGLLKLSAVLTDRFGLWSGKLFLVGFWAAAMTSLVGVWNGVSLMFADFVGRSRGLPAGHEDTRTGGRYFKWYLLWLTFPPMVMLFLGEPVALILAYGVLGAFFMPFLAVTLLWLLNTSRTPAEWHNKPLTNIALVLCTLAFAALALNQLWELVAGYV